MGTILRGRDLAALGITRHQRDARLAAGTLHRVERDVYCTEPPTGHLLLAALAEKRPHLVFSGPTARQLHDAAPITSPAHGLVARPAGYRSTRLLTVRQVRNLHHRFLDGLRVVSPLAAAAGLAGTHPSETSDFLERHYAGRGGRALLDTDLADLGRIPSALRDALTAAALFADSETERKLFRQLKKRGVDVEQNYRLGHYYWDGAIIRERVLIEIDSYLHHGPGSGEQTFTKDRWKANDGARRGWVVLHYTGECIFWHLGEVVQQIIDTLRWRRGLGALPQGPGLLDFEAAPPWAWHRAWHPGQGWSASVDDPPFF